MDFDAHNNPLPDGWVSSQSTSRPGQLSYENKHTGERVSWIPKQPASREEGGSADLYAPRARMHSIKKTNSRLGPTLEEPLPHGWTHTESRSRPGTLVYGNEHTGERISWIPTRPASRRAGESPDLMGPENEPVTNVSHEPLSHTCRVGGVGHRPAQGPSTPQIGSQRLCIRG